MKSFGASATRACALCAGPGASTIAGGDYELIFGAAKPEIKHVDPPVHSMERTYRETKMTGRLRNAWVMLRICLAA